MGASDLLSIVLSHVSKVPNKVLLLQVRLYVKEAEVWQNIWDTEEKAAAAEQAGEYFILLGAKLK